MGLLDVIKQHIRDQGPIPFASYMEMALYYPGLGYYVSGKDRIGEQGDFYTSPTTHPAFGALLCVQLEEMWRLLGEPAPFSVVEAGAGRGLLRRDILAFSAHYPPFSRALNYHVVERRPPAAPFAERGRQPPMVPLGKGDKQGDRAHRPEAIPEGIASEQAPALKGGATEAFPEGVAGCLLSNELWDAFPVHRVRGAGGRLREVHVALEGDRLVEVLGEPSDPELEAAARGLPEGQAREICLEVGRWLAQAASALERGYVMTFDYGYLSPGTSASLLGYQRHGVRQDVYADPGEQDLTCHVDFGAALRAGEKAGLDYLGLTTQREFLVALGIESFLEELPNRGLGQRDQLANRMSLLELVRPEGFGNFLVLLQSKNAPHAVLRGLTSGAPPLRLPPMLLPGPEHMRLLEGKYPHLRG